MARCDTALVLLIAVAAVGLATARLPRREPLQMVHEVNPWVRTPVTMKSSCI